MDAFVFDSKFARYVSQVDTRAIQQGTLIYNGGSVIIRTIAPTVIVGTVSPNKQTNYHVKLTDNEDGAFSGNCSCADIFNCAHSYALARAARDQILGIKREKKTTIKALSKSDPIVTEIEKRIQGKIDKPHQDALQSMERLWKISSKSDLTLYTKDLNPFLKDRNIPELKTNGILRELKPIVAKKRPQTYLDLADLIRAYCFHKGYAVKDGFARITSLDRYQKSFRKQPTEKSEKSWDSPPLKIDCSLMFDKTEDGWLNVSAKRIVKGESFSTSETKSLIDADGQLVEIHGKGWFRATEDKDSPISSFLAELGLDASRGNTQRIHISQIKDLVPDEYLNAETIELVKESQSTQDITLPPAPTPLAAILRPYQLEGFHFLCHLTLRKFGGILADDMGLGKTLQTLTWLLWLKERQTSPFRALIICPKSVVDNWLTEPEKFKTGLDVQVFKPSNKPTGSTPNIIVANYTQLRINSERFLEEDWDVVILDEGQYIKNPSSQTSKVAYKLQANQKLILSGTPIENHIKDLWSLMRFAMPRLLGPYPSFSLNYNLDKDPDAAKAISKRIQPFMIRRLKTQVAQDLPERIEKEIRCDLTTEQTTLYEQELDLLKGKLKQANDANSFNNERFNLLSSLMRLRQICCDPRLVKNGKTEVNETPAKIAALLDIVLPLMEEGHKVLIFSQFVSMLELLRIELESHQVRTHFLSGKTQNRKALIDTFQNNPEPSAFLLSLKAAGSGLNLTAASYVILFDPWWNPAVEAQAIDRCHRIGQKNQVVAYRLIAKNTIEDKIRALQNQKSDLANSIIHEDNLLKSMDLKTLNDLLD